MTSTTSTSRPSSPFLPMEVDSQAPEMGSLNKRSYPGLFGSDSTQAPVEERTSKAAKGSIGQDAVTQGPHSTSSSQLPSLQPLDPASISLLKIVDPGSRSGPFNHILSCLSTYDMATLAKVSRQFREIIQKADIEFIYKKQLEHKKVVTDTDLCIYQKLSGKYLSSSKIEFLIFSEFNALQSEFADDVNKEKLYDTFLNDPFSIAEKFENLEEIVFEHSDISDAHLIRFVCSCKKLMRLSISNLENITDEAVVTIAQSHPNLNTFKIEKCSRLTSRSLQGLARHCSGLQNLAVTDSSWASGEDLITMTRNCPQLRSLTIDHLGNLTDQIFAALAQNCPDLQNLTLKGHLNLSDENLILLATNCKKLKKLVVGKCQGITNRGLAALVQNCPDLKHLEIDSCLSLTEGFLFQTAAKCIEFLNFKVRLDKKLTAQIFAELAQNFSGIEDLTFEQSDPRTEEESDIKINRNGPKLGISIATGYRADQTLLAFVQHVPNLKMLIVKNCSSLNEECLVQIAAKCTMLKQFETHHPSEFRDSMINGRGLVALVQNCSDLKSMIVKCCSGFTDEDFINIALKQIKYLSLHIRWGEKLSDQSLMGFAQNCSGLERLKIRQSMKNLEDKIWIDKKGPNLEMSINGDSNITYCLAAFAQNSPKIKYLALEDSDITDARLIEISLNYSQIQDFIIKKCKNITDQGLATFIGNSSKLETLVVESCSGITENAFIQMGKSCPSLENLSLEFLDRVNTDELLTHLARIYPNLVNLRIRYNGNLRRIGKGLIELVETCSQLKSLSVGVYEYDDFETTEKIAQAHPNLQIDYHGNDDRYTSTKGCFWLTY